MAGRKLASLHTTGVLSCNCHIKFNIQLQIIKRFEQNNIIILSATAINFRTIQFYQLAEGATQATQLIVGKYFIDPNKYKSACSALIVGTFGMC